MVVAGGEPVFCVNTVLIAASLLHAGPQHGSIADIRAQQRSRDADFVDKLEHMPGSPTAGQLVVILQALQACAERARNSLRQHAPKAQAAATSSLRATLNSSSKRSGSNRSISSSKARRAHAAKLELATGLSKLLQRMSVLAQQLLAAALLGVDVPAARAAVTDQTVTWDAHGRVVACSGSSQLSSAALLGAGSFPLPEYVSHVAHIMSCGDEAADKQSKVQLTAGSFAQVLKQLQHSQQVQEPQQVQPQ
jgi:hypothetical protein